MYAIRSYYVQCKTCGGMHKYRPDDSAAAKSPLAPKAPKAPRAPRKTGGVSAAKKAAALSAIRVITSYSIHYTKLYDTWKRT